jgi:hypothetical protein
METNDEELALILELVGEEIAAIENGDDELIEASQDRLSILNDIYSKGRAL